MLRASWTISSWTPAAATISSRASESTAAADGGGNVARVLEQVPRDVIERRPRSFAARHPLDGELWKSAAQFGECGRRLGEQFAAAGRWILVAGQG